MGNQLDRELVIQAMEHGGCEIALLENKDLVEFHRDSDTSALQIGDIYWARVKKIMPPLNAVFVDIGEGKEAFLHYTDLGENFSSFLPFFKKLLTKEISRIEDFHKLTSLEKNGKIAEVFQVNDYIPVQILKEPISTKGARLSADISLAGRYLILTPFSGSVNVSKKIQNQSERDRLKQIAAKLVVKNMGVIIRTVAEGKTVKELHEDFLDLQAQWKKLCQKVVNAPGIVKLFEEQSKSNTLLRDILNDSFTKIHVNNLELSQSIQTYIQKIAPEKLEIVKFSKEKNLFEEFNLNSKIKSSFNRIIPLPSGGYIIIEYTEALCVIDINSGVHKAKKNNLEIDDSILKINLEAVKEIARQMRLRDIGGIIVIDFIDTKNPENREKVYEEMHARMKSDKASYTILPLSKFNLMQITRSRKRPQEKVQTREGCPTCFGTGKVSSVLLVTDMIFNKLQTITKLESGLKLQVHPFIYAYLREGFISRFTRWQWSLKSLISIQKNASLGINEYLIQDKQGEKILI